MSRMMSALRSTPPANTKHVRQEKDRTRITADRKRELFAAAAKRVADDHPHLLTELAKR